MSGSAERISCARIRSPLGKRTSDHFISRDLGQHEFWNFAAEWVRRARANDPSDLFSAFIHLWVVFNAWASVVVHDDEGGRESDRFLIAVLGHDTILSGRFNRLLEDDPTFRDLSTRFTSLWPVCDVRILRKLQLQAWDGRPSSRRHYLAEVVPQLDRYLGATRRSTRARDAFYSPPCVRDHVTNDWPHTLRAIYAVRCNLFHGGESFDRKGDQIFVDVAYEILWRIWQIEVPEWLRE